MENITKDVIQIVLQIRALKKIPPPFEEDYDDPLTEQIFNSNIEITTLEDYPVENKKPLSEITGINMKALPDPGKLSDSQKKLLAVELIDLLQHYHLFPYFPSEYPEDLKYVHIKKLWRGNYPEVRRGVCYINLCNYVKRDCPFKGYCSICDELEFEKYFFSQKKYSSSIYDYCDKRCNKCQFKDQCEIYPIHHLHESLDGKGIMKKLQSQIANKFEPLIEESALSYNFSRINKIQDIIYLQCGDWETGKIVKNSKIYNLRVLTWLFYHELFLEAKQILWEVLGCREKNYVALTTIRWNCFIISSNITKAKICLILESYWECGNRNVIKKHKSRIVKEALLSINKSILAWEEIRASLPEFDARIQYFIDFLVDLHSEIEEAFPDVTDFT